MLAGVKRGGRLAVRHACATRGDSGVGAPASAGARGAAEGAQHFFHRLPQYEHRAVTSASGTRRARRAPRGGSSARRPTATHARSRPEPPGAIQPDEARCAMPERTNGWSSPDIHFANGSVKPCFGRSTAARGSGRAASRAAAACRASARDARRDPARPHRAADDRQTAPALRGRAPSTSRRGRAAAAMPR